MIAASFPCAFSECLACMARFTTDQVNSPTQISVSLAVTLGSLCSFDWSYFPISSYNLLSFAWICIFEKNQKTLCVLTFWRKDQHLTGPVGNSKDSQTPYDWSLVMPDIYLQNYKHKPCVSNISTDLVNNPRYVAPKPVLCTSPLCQARTSGIRYILLCSSSGPSEYPTSCFFLFPIVLLKAEASLPNTAYFLVW